MLFLCGDVFSVAMKPFSFTWKAHSYAVPLTGSFLYNSEVLNLIKKPTEMTSCSLSYKDRVKAHKIVGANKERWHWQHVTGGVPTIL